MRKIFVCLLLSVFVLSCGSKKKAASHQKNKKKETTVVSKPKETTPKIEEETNIVAPKFTSTDSYILYFKDIAKEEMQETGIPASITLAQGILESGSGKGRLAVEANNHFGIKCHGWKGEEIYHDDDEDQECFRKYKNAETSFKDHSDFLTGRKRYANLFKLRKNDYKGWAKELRRAGYATDKKYPEKLISLIERYELYKYDAEVLGKKYNKPKQKKGLEVEHVVAKGDTLYSISKKYNLTVDKLKALNNLKGTNLSIGQVLIVQ